MFNDITMYGIIDCDNCYVSCERVFRPDLNGKPVVVLSNNDGCVVARSNEAKRMGISEGGVLGVMLGLSSVISSHLRNGDKVRLERWGLMKLEIESDKVDRPEQFRAKKHIRGVRLHFLPESEKGRPELYQDITFEKERNR